MISRVIGLVKDATNGIGINGATVSNNYLNIRKQSHEGGAYSMTFRSGDYTLEASAIGYNNQSKGVVIVPGRDILITRVNFDLKPAP